MRPAETILPSISCGAVWITLPIRQNKTPSTVKIGHEIAALIPADVSIVRKPAFIKALQKLIPTIRGSDLKPGRAGVRAQAVAPDGNLVDDFLIQTGERAIHVLNAPSPAATASLAIAEHIVDQI